MTILDSLDHEALSMVTGEDPMELSMDIERRYAGDDDIDIDLVLDGKSPHSLDDDYMLEDQDNHGTYNGEYTGNDDEMADDGGVTEEIDNCQVYAGGNHEDMDEFDILVDDEDLQDAEDSGISYDQTSQMPSVYLQPSNKSPDAVSYTGDQNEYHSSSTNFPGHDLSHSDGGMANSLNAYTGQSFQYSEDLASSVGESKPAEFVQKTTTSPTISEQPTIGPPPEDTGISLSEDAATIGEYHVVQSSSPKQTTEQDEERNHNLDELTQDHNPGNLPRTPPDQNADVPRTAQQTQEAIHESHSSHIDQSGSPRIASPNLNANDSGSNRLDPVQHDTAGEDKGDQLHVVNSPHDATYLHPVIVVYQESEIYLFPPHEQNDEQSQTYFLEDESYANGTIRTLLGACRLILADSISDQEELELKIAPLKLEISETSTASSAASLTQVLDIYLQLQLNDGIENPEPLRMTLTTKYSFLNRLGYLDGAVAAGMGYLALTEPEDNEVINEFEDDDHADGASPADLNEHGNINGHILLSDNEAADTFHPDANNEEQLELGKVDRSIERISDNQIDGEEGNDPHNPQLEVSIHPNGSLSSPPPVQQGDVGSQVMTREDLRSKDNEILQDSPAHSHSTQTAEPFLVDQLGEDDRSEAEGNLPVSSISPSTLQGDDSDNAGAPPSRQSTDHVPAPVDKIVELKAKEPPCTAEHSGWTANSDKGESYLTSHTEAEASINHKHVGPDDGEDVFEFLQADHRDVLSGDDENEAHYLEEGKYDDLEAHGESVDSKKEIEGAFNGDEDQITFDDPEEDPSDEGNSAEGHSSYLLLKQNDDDNYSNNNPLAAKRDSVKRARLEEEDDEVAEHESTLESKRFRSN